MELYDKVKQQFNESLQASIIESMNQRDIRYDLNSTGEPYKYLTVFSISKDIKLPKNLRTKARLARPQLDVQYIRERNFDYATVSSPDFKKKNEHDLRPINFLWGELEDITEFADTKTRIIAWCRSIFSELSKTYKDEYGITLYLMPMEFYLPNYKGLCISKIPKFEDLVFLNSDTHVRISSDTIIKQRAESIKELSQTSFFKS